ncbi:glutathione S-transferase family protein [Zavarzinia sp. CC-PAN008]|uniref:glutathione S-transferase family protein n=1 Tax=Zavarzinia sp. CC-PAN008 TaxID=3243332 RepID=UPI003F745C00
MTLKIYGIPGSRAYRTFWMALEMGVPFESEPVFYAKPESITPEFLKANPNNRVPAIDDEGLTLYESMAINLYLARKHGGPLAPTNLAEEGKALQWSFWAMSELEANSLQLAMHRMFLPEGQRDPAKAEAANAALQKPLAVLEQALADQPYLLGDRFTVADLNVAAVLSWARTVKIDLGAFPKVEQWLTACLGRPAAGQARKGKAA